MIESLREFQSQLLLLRKEISAVKTDRVSKKSICSTAEKLGEKWFSEFSEQLENQHGISQDLIKSYSQNFEGLIKVSAPNNLKTRYEKILSTILKNIRNDLVIPLQTQPKGASRVSLLSAVLADLPSGAESAYLKEAIECARHDYYRASVVLGWCAVIDRIHRSIEKAGFAKFNISSSTMASQTTGRFKKFKAVQNVSSLSEIREVFDNIILWILEGMGFIDNNQHTRLRSCFEMRCQCSHPGDAPVTEYNLMSYFSDLNEIIFKNDKFKTD